jgi:alpha-beta hydrolase superfamily lysophospholipase
MPAVFKEAEKLHFRFQNYNITGYRWNYGAGRKALIIHGFESSAVNFDKYVSPLINKGYEVLAFDAPAHGLSSGTRITAPLYRDLIKHVHREYGPIQSFMAHSFGGLAVCMALAEMSHDQDTRLALVAPATESRTAIDQFFHYLQLPDAEEI